VRKAAITQFVRAVPGPRFANPTRTSECAWQPSTNRWWARPAMGDLMRVEFFEHEALQIYQTENPQSEIRCSSDSSDRLYCRGRSG
jgi:hypothetical protein